MELDNRDIDDNSWGLERLAEDELAAIEFFNELSQDEARRQTYINGFISDAQEYLARLENEPSEVYNGPLVGIVAAFAFNWVTAGIAVALITLGAGLIQWALSDKSSTAERKADPRFAETYSGSAGAGTVRLGEPIPAIFCNQDIDSSGGVQTPGQLVFSRVETIKGAHKLYARYVISHGYVSEIDLDRTLINDQPLDTFVQRPVMSWLPGSSDQVVSPNFRFYSQNIPLSNNNRSNIRSIDEDAVASGDRLNYSETEFNEKFISFSLGGLYYYDNGGTSQGLFKIIEKRNYGGEFYIRTSPALPNGVTATIFEYQEARYQTTKPVNELEINFSCNIWGRDSNNNLIPFAQLFELQFAPINKANSNDFKSVCQLYIYSTNPQRILRSINIINLPLDTYVIKILPRNFAGSVPIYELWDFGFNNEVSPDFGMIGATPRIRIDGYATTLNNTEIFDKISQRAARVPYNSPQQGAALEIISVNEIEGSAQGTDVNMRGLATVQIEAEISAGINGSLNFTFFVARGIITRQLLAAGIADEGSSGNVLKYFAEHGQGAGVGTNSLTIANHTKRRTSLVDNLPDGITVIAANNIDLEDGDMWSLFRFHSSCWWPEIYAELCLNPKFGVEAKVIADYYLDWINLVETCEWLQGSNEFNQRFAWHGALNQTEELAKLNEEQARKVLLQPWRGQGLAGFWPYKTPSGAVPIFNASNATDFKIEYLTNQPPNQITVVYQEQEQLYVPGSLGGVTVVTQTITATTRAAYQGSEPIRSQTLKIPECTSRDQAIKVAQVYLNQARYGSRIVASHTAKTIESLHYYPGSLYRIMTATTSYSDEQSGIVVAKSDSAREFRIDREFTLVRSTTNYTVSNAVGLSDDRINFVTAGVSVGDIVKNLESDLTSIVTSVSTHQLGCNPPIPADTHYQIGDLTVDGLVAACSGGNGDIRAPQGFTARYAGDGHIWLKLNDNYLPNIGDIVGIGKNSLNNRLFQALALTVQLDEVDDNKVAQLSVGLSGVNWDTRFFDFSDIVIQTRYGTFNN